MLRQAGVYPLEIYGEERLRESAAILRLARAGLCTLVTQPHALEEARRNLRLKHPKAAGALEELVAATSVEPEAPPKSIAWALEQGLPLKDAPILAAAAQARRDVAIRARLDDHRLSPALPDERPFP